MRKYMVFIHDTAREHTRSTTKYHYREFKPGLTCQKSYFFLAIYEFWESFGSDVCALAR